MVIFEGIGLRCAEAYRDFSGNVTQELHADPRWQGCSNFACQLHLALRLYNDVTGFEMLGLTSETGFPLTTPTVRLIRYCSKEDTKEQKDDASQLVALLRQAVQKSKAVHIVSAQLATARDQGFRDLFYIAQLA